MNDHIVTRTYSLEQLVCIAEAAEPFARLLDTNQRHHKDSDVMYRFNRRAVTFGQLRSLADALNPPDAHEVVL